MSAYNFFHEENPSRSGFEPATHRWHRLSSGHCTGSQKQLNSSGP